VFTGSEIALGKQLTLFGVPTFVTLSPRLCPQQAFTENIGLSAEVRLSRQWLMALSGDPVGSCAGLLAGPGSALRYQLGLDLFWQRIY
jgi:hypothetical protein